MLIPALPDEILEATDRFLSLSSKSVILGAALSVRGTSSTSLAAAAAPTLLRRWIIVKTGTYANAAVTGGGHWRFPRLQGTVSRSISRIGTYRAQRGYLGACPVTSATDSLLRVPPVGPENSPDHLAGCRNRRRCSRELQDHQRRRAIVSSSEALLRLHRAVDHNSAPVM